MGDGLGDWEAKGYQLKDGKLVKVNSTNPVKKKSGRAKYGNTKVTIDDFVFDSVKEGRYYTELKFRKKAKDIKDFKKQVKFAIKIGDVHIANYFLDFQVEHNDGSTEYIDIKGRDKTTNEWITTDVFKLKKKLVEAIYKIEIILI